MTRNLLPYLAALLVLLALDTLWLAVIAKTVYRQAIGHLMAEQPQLWAAAVFYAVYAAGLMVFAVLPQADDPGWGRTVAMGALFGFFAYATYDLSNLATLKNWPLPLTLLDLAWGTVLSGITAGAAKAALNWAARA